jgi:putative signal transducing protein
MADLDEQDEQQDEQKDVQEPDEQLVKVFDTEQESEAMVVRGLLEANGIASFIENLDAPQDVLPGVGGVIILVRAEQAEEAARLIEESRTDLPDDEAVSEEPV